MDSTMTYDYYGNLVKAVDPKTVTRLADITPFDERMPGEAPAETVLPEQGAYEDYQG